MDGRCGLLAALRVACQFLGENRCNRQCTARTCVRPRAAALGVLRCRQKNPHRPPVLSTCLGQSCPPSQSARPAQPPSLGTPSGQFDWSNAGVVLKVGPNRPTKVRFRWELTGPAPAEMARNGKDQLPHKERRQTYHLVCQHPSSAGLFWAEFPRGTRLRFVARSGRPPRPTSDKDASSSWDPAVRHPHMRSDGARLRCRRRSPCRIRRTVRLRAQTRMTRAERMRRRRCRSRERRVRSRKRLLRTPLNTPHTTCT